MAYSEFIRPTFPTNWRLDKPHNTARDEDMYVQNCNWASCVELSLLTVERSMCTLAVSVEDI